MGRLIVRRGELVLARVVFPRVCILASFKFVDILVLAFWWLCWRSWMGWVGPGILAFLDGCSWLCYGSGKESLETCRRNGQNWYGRMFNNRFYPLCFFFVITEVYWGTRVSGKHRDGCGNPRRIRMWYLSFTYTPVSPLTWFLVRGRSKRERANERNIYCKTYVLYISFKVSKLQANSLSLSATLGRPSFSLFDRLAENCFWVAGGGVYRARVTDKLGWGSRE